MVLVFSAGMAYGQKKKPETTTNSGNKNNQGYEKRKSVIRTAIKFQDPGPAVNAYYDLLAMYPDSVQYLDSLAFLYYQVGMNQQCILVSSEILSSNPNNLAILEVKAVSEKNLGLIKMALEDFEKLLPATKNIQHQYQIATLQYDLKRLGECQLTIKSLLQREDLDQAKVTVFYGQGLSQTVSMKAAIYNMEGVILKDLNENERAMEMFQKSIQLEPEFALALNNKTSLEKKAENGKQEKK